MIALLFILCFLGRILLPVSSSALNLGDLKFKPALRADLYHQSLHSVLVRSIVQKNDASQRSSERENNLVSSANFSCVSFSSTYSPEIFCSNVVDYPFYLPANTTLQELEREARERASAYPTSYLDGKCLSNVKRNICASLYLQCVPNGN